MFSSLKFFLPLTFIFGTSGAFAANNIFTDVGFSQQDFKNVSKDLASAFSHTTNSGAASLGKVFGLELGLVAGGVESKYLKDKAEEISGEPQDQFKYLPYAGVVFGFSSAYGLGIEASIIPEIELGGGDGEFSNYSGALKWTLTDLIPLAGSFSPIKIALHTSYGETNLYYTYNGSGVSTETADFNISNFEYGLTLGLDVYFLEPYLSVGYVKTTSMLDAATDYVPPIPGLIIADQHFDAKLEGARLKAGLLLKLPFFRFGLEMSNLQSANRYTAKLSVKF